MDRIILPKRSISKTDAPQGQTTPKNGQRLSVAEQLATVNQPAKLSSHQPEQPSQRLKKGR